LSQFSSCCTVVKRLSDPHGLGALTGYAAAVCGSHLWAVIARQDVCKIFRVGHGMRVHPHLMHLEFRLADCQLCRLSARTKHRDGAERERERERETEIERQREISAPGAVGCGACAVKTPKETARLH
jgi:hypothetical protein